MTLCSQKTCSNNMPWYMKCYIMLFMWKFDNAFYVEIWQCFSCGNLTPASPRNVINVRTCTLLKLISTPQPPLCWVTPEWQSRYCTIEAVILYRLQCIRTRYTVEPLSNDHPHQRPSLLYDHISCDGQCFLFIWSLTSDHPSDATSNRVRWNFLPRGQPHRVFQNDCGMNVR